MVNGCPQKKLYSQIKAGLGFKSGGCCSASKARENSYEGNLSDSSKMLLKTGSINELKQSTVLSMGSPRSLGRRNSSTNSMLAKDDEMANPLGCLPTPCTILNSLIEYKKCLDNVSQCTCTCTSHPYFCCCVDRMEFMNAFQDQKYRQLEKQMDRSKV